MRLFFLCLSFLCLAACSKKSDHTLRVGMTNGPHAEIIEYVQKRAKAEGLDLELVPFDDFIQPNVALDAGDIDVNIYQHLPFLQEQMKSRGYDFVVVGKAITLPLGIYGADHVTSLSTLKHGTKVLISVDPSNAARSLMLLEKAGLLTLSNHINPSVKDIQENPLGLKIIEVEAPLIPRLLKDDADIAVIIADWVMVSGMDANKALFKEDAKSTYANLIVVKKGSETRADIQKLLHIYQSDDVKKFILEKFKGAILPAW